MRTKIGLCFLLALFVFPGVCRAVNFYDGVRAPKGLYFLTYSSYFGADKSTAADAGTDKKDYGYAKYEEILRLCYYSPNAVFTAVVPFGSVKSGYYHEHSSGLGDISLGAGYFLPYKKADILPALFVETPTGHYDANKTVNYGSNQYDIKPSLYLYKAIGPCSVDAVARYFLRSENHKTDVAPGDEMHLQLLLGWQATKRSKFGPSFAWYKSRAREVGGVKVSGTRREALSAGPEFYYRFPRFSATLTYLGDIRTKNTTKGHFFQLKTCYKF
jgi:hypothetical protein